MAFERKYSDEVRTKSVEAVLRRRAVEPRNRSIIREVAEEFDVGHQSLRQWLVRYDDGSYDYADEPAAHAHPEVSRDELLRRIDELEARLEVLDADNRSLTRVISLLSTQLRDGDGGAVPRKKSQ